MTDRLPCALCGTPCHPKKEACTECREERPAEVAELRANREQAREETLERRKVKDQILTARRLREKAILPVFEVRSEGFVASCLPQFILVTPELLDPLPGPLERYGGLLRINCANGQADYEVVPDPSRGETDDILFRRVAGGIGKKLGAKV